MSDTKATEAFDSWNKYRGRINVVVSAGVDFYTEEEKADRFRVTPVFGRFVNEYFPKPQTHPGK